MTWLEDTAKLAEENEWWTIEDNSPTTVADFYRYWENLSHDYAGQDDVVCLVPLAGYFSLRGGEIYRVEPVKRHEMNNGWQSGGTRERATQDELSQLDWAIEHGACDLYLYPHTKLGGDIPRKILAGTGFKMSADNQSY